MSENSFKQQYEIFLIKAKQDLVLVEQVINNPDVSDEIKYFHLQQSVEKALKSLLSFKGVQFPKTHDIEDLIELAEENHFALPTFINILAELTPYAVEFRYALSFDSLHEPEYYLLYVKDFIEFVASLVKA